MDIAKIRKKLKEKKAEGQQSLNDTQKAEEHEATILKSYGKNSELTATEANLNQEAKAVEIERIEVEEEKNKAKRIEDKIGGDKRTEVIEILVFSLLKEEFAFRVSQIEEIRRSQRITKVPKMPNYVLGVTSLRGKVIPVIDLKTKFSLEDRPSDIDKSGRILIIKGTKGLIGVTVDRVIGVVHIAKTEFLPPPSHLTEAELKFIEGIAIIDKRFISIINTEEAINISKEREA
jgi:purine-binding chemotaxis protein CheW